MSELKKTIKINPELFNMKADKTRKNTGEKKTKDLSAFSDKRVFAEKTIFESNQGTQNKRKYV
jgi:hypothetical protein